MVGKVKTGEHLVPHCVQLKYPALPLGTGDESHKVGTNRRTAFSSPGQFFCPLLPERSLVHGDHEAGALAGALALAGAGVIA